MQELCLDLKIHIYNEKKEKENLTFFKHMQVGIALY